MSGRMVSRPRWVVLNQSHNAAFEAQIERLATSLGPCLLCSGAREEALVGPPLTVWRGPSYHRGSFRQRVASWLQFVAWCTAQMTRVRGHPMLFAATNPPLLPHLAWALRRLRRWPYALLIWDIYPDHIVSMGWLPEWHPLVRAWRRLNRWALTGAEVVITLGDRMAETLRAGLGRDAGHARIEVVPNWAATDFICPLDKADNPFAVEHGQVGVTTVLYSGNMGASHGLKTLVEAADRLRDEPRLRFLCVGDGLGRAELEREVARRRLRNMQIIDYQAWEMLPFSLATGDIAVVTQRPGTEHLSMPSKTYSSMAAGSALLALTDPDSDLGRLVRQREIGVVCDYDDAESVSRWLGWLLDNPERLVTMGNESRRLAETEYSSEAVYRRLERLLLPIVERS